MVLSVSSAVSLGAWALGWITPWAAVLVALMGATVILRLGWFWTLPPVLFLAVGSVLSGGRKGKRNALQVLANGGMATLWALLGDPGAYLTALTVGFSDTVATEVGTRLSPRAYLITDLREVPPGTSGGVSLPGTLAGVGTVLLMASFLLLSGEGHLLPFLLSSTVGLFSDSLVGATLERRGLFGNDTTNLLATATGSTLYALLTRLLGTSP